MLSGVVLALAVVFCLDDRLPGTARIIIMPMLESIEKVFDKLSDIVEANRRGENICFISRGEWADPQIAYQGKLLNYWDVEDGLPEDCDEPSDADWIDACIDSYFGYTESGCELDNFTRSDAWSVYSVIKTPSFLHKS